METRRGGGLKDWREGSKRCKCFLSNSKVVKFQSCIDLTALRACRNLLSQFQANLNLGGELRHKILSISLGE